MTEKRPFFLLGLWHFGVTYLPAHSWEEYSLVSFAKTTIEVFFFFFEGD